MEKFLVSLRAHWAALTGDETGATGTEYALLVAFVALVLIVGATLFGQALSDWFATLAGQVAGWATSP